jgi:hypothetical protein
MNELAVPLANREEFEAMLDMWREAERNAETVEQKSTLQPL